ncbi:MAG TPA: Spy/CpxP family protein refolding chaperone [Rhodanobacteraceae bacterium]|nr:Spy/CpxP family protein refolding chaperone [Rhodanobacteraceae bacterium]
MGLLRQLDLTDTQRASVHQLMQQSFEQAHSGMQALHEKRMAFEKAVPGSAGYQAAANELAEAESSAAHARVLREADLRAKIHDLLTPAQRTQLANLREQRETKMKQWRESRMQKRSMQAPAAASTAD